MRTPDEIALILNAEIPGAGTEGYCMFDLVAAANVTDVGGWMAFLHKANPEVTMLHELGFTETMTALVGMGFALGKLAAKNEKTLPKVQ